MRKVGPRAVIATALVLLVGCGAFQPFATPFVRRPALPPGVEFPQLPAEEAVERLEVLGFACRFEPDSDIRGGWSCSRGGQAAGDSMDVSIDSDETGPITGVAADFDAEGHTKDALDAIAAATFEEVMLSVFIPDEVHPAGPDFVAIVAANWPTDLGEGWLLGFDRSSTDRRMRIVFSEVGIQAEP